jgi:cytochrome c-type biogenesis protein CcmF
MTVLGHWVTVFGLVASAAASFHYFRAESANQDSIRKARIWLMLSISAILVASALLLVLLLTHDFTNGYVYRYSSRSLPLYFLVSAFYAGQEGSFLFWSLCSAILAWALMKYVSRRKSEVWVMSVFMAVHSFLLLLLIAKSPFTHLWETFPQVGVGTVPPDGRGLNPLLQNFWMVIHPPVLFVGFAALAVPFSFAVAGLWKKQYTLLEAQALPWVLFGTAALGMGIMLGAYWAYGVLGWGGYWGWDPVENSSLVPWLTSLALIHTMIAQRRTMKYLRTNLSLAIVSFFLVVYSTFLTRSGILGDASVHSFVDPGALVYILLIVFLVLIAVSGFGLMYLRRSELRGAASSSASWNRETFLAAGSLTLLLSALVILFGTSVPILSNRTVETTFYDTTNFPVAVAISLLMGLSLFTQWGIDNGREILRRSVKSIVTSLAVLVALIALGLRDPWMACFAFSAAFAFFVNLEIGLKVARGDPSFLGGKLAHAGLAVFFLGVISTGRYSSSQHLSLELNTPQHVLGYTLTYTGHRPTEDGKFAFDIVAEDGSGRFSLSPLMFDAGEQGVMRNPDIASFLTKDLYVSPVSLDDGDARTDRSNETYTIPKGGTVFMGEVEVRFVKFDMGEHGTLAEGSDMAIGSVLEVTRGNSKETVIPVAVYRENGATLTYSLCR